MAIACYKLSHFDSWVFIIDFTWNLCRLHEAKNFSRNLGQFNCVTRTSRYHLSIAEFLIQNLWNQVAELVGRPRTMLKIFYFSRSHQFFQTSPRIKSLYVRGRKLIHLLAGEATSGNLLTVEATGVHLTRALGQGLNMDQWLHSKHNRHFPQKFKTVTFTHFLMLVIRYNIVKI